MAISRRQTNETLRRDMWRACDTLCVRRGNNCGGVTKLGGSYRRPARSEIVVIVERSQTDGQPHLKLLPKQDSEQARVRLDSLKWLLNLEARWDGELGEDRLSAKFEEALLHVTQDERAAGVLIDRNGFNRKLELITDTMSKPIGKIVGEVPALAYTRWLGGDTESSSEWYERYRLWNLADATLPDQSNGQNHD